MRILIVTTFFPPLNSIASLRPYSWAKYWTRAGHNVSVLTLPKQHVGDNALSLPNPGYRVIEARLPSFIEKLKGSYYNGRGVTPSRAKGLFLNLYGYLRFERGIFNACRMPDFSDFWIRPALKQISLLPPWDLVVTSSGPYAVHFVGRHLKKRNLAGKWLADFRDPWCDNHIYPGIFPFNQLERFIEKWAVAQADAIISVSPAIVSSLAARHGENRVHLIENGFDREDMTGLDPQFFFPRDGKFRIVHTGSIYPPFQDPLPLFEAIRRLAAKPLFSAKLDRCEVIFAGQKLDFIQGLIQKYNLESVVKIAGFVKREDALRMQRDAHALLFLAWNNPKNTGAGVTTGKLFEYLFSGTPILAIGGKGVEQSQKMIKDLHGGWIINNTNELTEFLFEQLLDQAKVPSKVNQEELRMFSREYLALKMLEIAK